MLEQLCLDGGHAVLGDQALCSPTPPAPYVRLLALAERNPRRAVHLVSRWWAAGDQLATDVWSHYVLGWALLRWERVDAAHMHFDAAYAAFLAQDAVSLAHECHYGQLLARQLSGEGPALQDAWEELIAAYTQAGQWRAAARAGNEQIAHLNVLGRPREAWALVQHNAPLIQQYSTQAERARYAHVAGVAAGGCGDLSTAYAEIEHARIIFTELRRPIDVARVLFERAWIWQRRERFDHARADLERALATFERFDLPMRVAFCQKDLGIVACYTGDYAAAIAYAMQAHTRFTALERRDLVAYCDQNLGVIAYYSGLFDLALAAYQRAQTAYAALGNQRFFLMCQRNQALILCAQRRPAEAIALLDSIAPSVWANGDQIELVEAHVARALALRQLGQPTKALAYLAEAHTQLLAHGNTGAAAQCRIEQGWLHLDQGQWQAAAACFHAALEPLVDRPANRWQVLYGLGRLAEYQGDPPTALAHYHEAGAIVAGLRRKLASEHASSAIFVQAQHLYDDALRLAVQHGCGEQLLSFAEQRRAFVLQRQMAAAHLAPLDVQARREQQRVRLRDLLAHKAPVEALDQALQDYIDTLLLARHHTHPDVEAPHVPFDLRLIRQHLALAYGTDWTLLVPIIVGAELVLVMLTQDSLTLTQTPFDAALQSLLERACLPRYRLTTYRDLPYLRGQETTDWAVPRALADRLLAPTLRARLHPMHHLLIIPSGPLHALPWAALRLDQVWLCECAIVHYLPALATKPMLVDPPHGQAALLIGCADFGGRAPNLPCAIDSLDVVQRHWPGPLTRRESMQATRQALLQDALHQYQLIHIASHAYASAGRGLLAHIKLTDDDLLIDEVLHLHLSDALVVLAACQGAASEVLPGDEILGLSQALLAAGAVCVVASFWPIYDQAVLRILDPLYTALARGDDPATALAWTQRELIRPRETQDATAEIMQSPFIWACFCVTSAGVLYKP